MILLQNERIKSVIFALMTTALFLSVLIPFHSASPSLKRTRATITWNGNVYLDSHTNIPKGTLLMIEAGTNITLEWGIDIWVHGTIVVNGTFAEPVTFKRATNEDPWGSIHIYADSENSIIRYAHIYGAGYGVRGDGGRFLIENSLTYNCKYGIGAVANSHITIKDSLINNSWYHSLFGQASTVIFNDTIIGAAREPSMYLSGKNGTGCTVIFINGSYDFNTLDIQDAQTEVYRCWPVDVSVKNLIGEPMVGAKITFERNNLYKEFQGITNDRGEAADITLTQMMYKKVGPTTFNPFKLTVEKEGYGDNVTTWNIIAPRNIRLTMEPSNEGPAIEQGIGNFTTFQNSPDKRLADLREFFEDDTTPDDELNFTIIYNSHPDDVCFSIIDSYFLTVNTTCNKLYNGVVSTKVRATDAKGGSTLSNKIYVTVIKVPLPPEINAFPDFELEEDSSLLAALYLYNYIDDPDTNYEYLSVFISSNGHGENVLVICTNDVLRIIPIDNYFGNALVEITVSDGNFTNSDWFFVNITPVNDPPELVLSSPKYGDHVLPNVTLEGVATDIDGDELYLIVKFEGTEQKFSILSYFVVELDLVDHMGNELWIYVKVNDGKENSTPAEQLKLNVIDIQAYDSDGDGLPDDVDEDDDGDGVPDLSDDFPNDPAASKDTDSDGYPDEWNPGQIESNSTTGLKLDIFPYNPTEWIDSDSDGVGDNSDDFPEDPSASLDSDEDGFPDEWNPGYTAEDSVSLLHLDAFPHDPAASLDRDTDGYPDVWHSGMNENSSTTGLTLDLYPDDPTKQTNEIVAPGGNGTTRIDEDTPGFGMISALIFILMVIIVKRRRFS